MLFKEKNRCLFQESRETLKYTLSTKFNVKTDGKCSNHIAVKG
jgi:hypothetical protein